MARIEDKRTAAYLTALIAFLVFPAAVLALYGGVGEWLLFEYRRPADTGGLQRYFERYGGLVTAGDVGGLREHTGLSADDARERIAAHGDLGLHDPLVVRVERIEPLFGCYRNEDVVATVHFTTQDGGTLTVVENLCWMQERRRTDRWHSTLTAALWVWRWRWHLTPAPA